MPVTITRAQQLAPGFRRYPIDDHGKMRTLYARCVQSGLGDPGSSFIIGSLPPGRVRLYPWECRYKGVALGAARLMALGHDDYFALSTPATSPPVAAVVNAFGGAIDVSAATENLFPVTGGIKHDMYSRDGVQLRATFTGGTIADLSVFEFIIGYSCE